MVRQRNIAPPNCRVVADRRTKSSERLEKAQMATNVIGIEQRENDIAHRFTGIVLLSWYASCTGIATGAIEITVMVCAMMHRPTTARISQR